MTWRCGCGDDSFAPGDIYSPAQCEPGGIFFFLNYGTVVPASIGNNNFKRKTFL